MALNIPHRHSDICVFLLAPLLIKSSLSGEWMDQTASPTGSAQAGMLLFSLTVTALALWFTKMRWPACMNCDCPGGPPGGLVAVCDVICSGQGPERLLLQ